MLVSILPVPFGDAGRQRQYEAVRAALQADAEVDAPATVLLGNLGAFSPAEVDMLVVRPTGLMLAVLVPQSGQLTMSTLAYGAWQLDGQPLPGRNDAANPFAQFQQQLPVALAWLSEQLGLPENELPPCTGVALFDAPLTFGPEVEAQLHRHAAALDFQLVGGAGQLRARLLQQPQAEAGILTEDELLNWGGYLANNPYASPERGVPASLPEGLPAYLEQKLRQLWRWLGAEDIPADPPYGGPPPDQHLRDQQEQARLQQLKQELQAELHRQRQEAAAREAARTQELAQLRQQLTQTSPSPTEREAEQRAKAALEESLRTARAELATRNNELDARIQQLGQLIGQLQAAPAASTMPSGGRPVTPAAAVPKVPKSRLAAPGRGFHRLRQAERWGLAALVLAGVGAGTWGVVRWMHHPAPRPAAVVARRAAPDETFDENQSADQNDSTDGPADAQVAAADTAAIPAFQPDQATAEPAAAPELITQPAVLHIDSAKVIDKVTPLKMGADSAASTSPAP